MEFSHIIRDFAHSERIPIAAIRAATSDPERFVPGAIDLLVRVTSGRATEAEQQAVSVLVHVLGEIGDRRAFAPLVDLLSLPSDDLDRILGDSVTESVDRILAHLAEGKDAPRLQQAFEDPSIDQFARDSIINAWAYLVLNGEIDRVEARTYLENFPARARLKANDYGWVSWVDAVSHLGFEDLSGLVEQVFADGKITADVLGIAPMTLRDFRQQLQETLADEKAWLRNRQFQPFADTVGELSTWYSYSEKARRERQREVPLLPQSFVSAVNTNRDVGRNDPCPCGSGKKFKKCCLQS